MLNRLKQLYGNFSTHLGVRRYVANTAWMFSERILRLISGLLVGVWVARYLGPEQFGVFSYAIAFAALFGSIAKLGLDGIVVRDLVREPDQREQYLGTAFWLKMGGAVVMLVVIALATQLTTNDKEINLYILIIASGTIFQSFEVVDFYFQSQAQSKLVSISKLIQLTLSSLLKIYLVYTGADLLAFVMVSLVDQIVLALSLYFAYRYQKLEEFYRYFEWNKAKQLLKDSWPMILGGLVLMVQARVDQVMLKEMIGNTELGYYSSAMRLIEVFSFVPVVLTTALFPAIVNAKQISESLYKNRLFNLYRLMMFLFLITAIPIYLLGSHIISFLYTDAFAPAGLLFSLMAWRLLFTNYGVVRGAYLMTENLTKYSMITMMIGGLTNVALNYLWIPAYHSVGAIWASIVSFFITTFLIDLYYVRTRENCKMMIKSMFLVLNYGRNKC